MSERSGHIVPTNPGKLESFMKKVLDYVRRTKQTGALKGPGLIFSGAALP